MKVDTMRSIDRRVGVPLCALATELLRLWWLIWPGRPRAVRAVLFVELSEMGSTVLATPAMRKAQQKLNAELYFVSFRRVGGSLDLLGTVPRANVFTLRDDSLWHLALDTFGFLIWTRRKNIDTVIDLELFSRFTALLTGFSGAERRVGFHRIHNEGLYRGDMLSHRVAYNPHIHIAKNFIAMVDALLVAEPTQYYAKTLIGDDQLAISPIRATDAACDAIAARIRARMPQYERNRQRIVLINPNASEMLPHRRWMPDRYAELIRRILKTYDDVLVVITGAPNEREEAAVLASQCDAARCLSLAGETTLIELPPLYTLATAMVTNDSGPSHFAAATGLPTIVLFGPETPNLYRPLGNSRTIYAGLACSPCVSAHNHRKTACTNNVCMQAITVDEVFRAVNDVLSAPTTA
jgi:ADP-heptose:LPS heptosyltransferase